MQVTRPLETLSHPYEPFGAVELPPGRLVTWADDCDLTVWSLAGGGAPAVLSGHEVFVTGAVPLEPERLLSWSQDGTLRLWRASGGPAERVFEGHGRRQVAHAQLLPGGRALSQGLDEALCLWDLESADPLRLRIEHAVSHPRGMPDALPEEVVRVLADGRLLAAHREVVRLWNGETGALAAVLAGHTDGIVGTLLLPDDALLSWSADGTLRVWCLKTATARHLLEGHTRPVSGAVALLDGERVVSWSLDGTARLWEVASGEQIATLTGHEAPVELALVLGSARLLTSAHDRTTRLWDAAGGLEAVLPIEALGVLPLDTERLLIWSGQDELELWDLAGREQVAVWRGHGGIVLGALELSDGRVASWARDGSICVWDRPAGAR